MRDLIQQSLPKPVNNILEELDSLTFMDFVFKLEDMLEKEYGWEVNLLDDGGVEHFKSIDELEAYLCGLKASV